MHYDPRVGYNVGSLSGREVKSSMGLGSKIVGAMKKTANQAKVNARKADARPSALRKNGPGGIPSIKQRKFFGIRPPGSPR